MNMTTSATGRAAAIDRQRLGLSGRDRRGRLASTPPILHYGFRPFFLAAALYAGLAIPLWMWVYASGLVLPGAFSGLEWHVHEMLFGYVAAVIAGFILTAVPNWTGRLPLSGAPLALLVGLWVLGRLACALVAAPVAAMVLDLAFPAALAAAIWREVIAGRNWRNAPVAVMLTLFGLANLTHHLELMGAVPDGLAVRLALGVVATLVALIGGRIVPSFTRNWLVKQGREALPASFGMPDKLALVSVVAAMVLWIAGAPDSLAGPVLMVAGTLLFVRLFRWRGGASWREPILLILHVGYAWLALSMLLLGLSALWSFVPASVPIHALTAGAIGTMTLAVMTRASLGHTGREIKADAATIVIYLAVTAGAALRVAAPFSTDNYMLTLVAGGGLWSFAFLLFAARYGPMLLRARRSG